MTTALYLLGCLLFGGGTVVFLLAAPVGDERVPGSRSAPRPVPPGAASAPVPSPQSAPDTDMGYVDDFTRWERELRSGRRMGWEHDQRARREMSRWEREARRRRRQREQ